MNLVIDNPYYELNSMGSKSIYILTSEQSKLIVNDVQLITDIIPHDECQLRLITKTLGQHPVIYRTYISSGFVFPIPNNQSLYVLVSILENNGEKRLYGVLSLSALLKLESTGEIN